MDKQTAELAPVRKYGTGEPMERRWEIGQVYSGFPRADHSNLQLRIELRDGPEVDHIALPAGDTEALLSLARLIAGMLGYQLAPADAEMGGGSGS